MSVLCAGTTKKLKEFVFFFKSKLAYTCSRWGPFHKSKDYLFRYYVSKAEIFRIHLNFAKIFEMYVDAAESMQLKILLSSSLVGKLSQ